MIYGGLCGLNRNSINHAFGEILRISLWRNQASGAGFGFVPTGVAHGDSWRFRRGLTGRKLIQTQASLQQGIRCVLVAVIELIALNHFCGVRG